MEWQARWVWAASQSTTPNFYLYARREFDLPGPASARIFITCASEYKLYVNGKPIGRGPAPCDTGPMSYDEYDVTHAIRPGRNVIAALCHHYGVATAFRPLAPGGLLLQAIFSNGHEEIVIGTDDHWKVKPADEWALGSARMSQETGFQEVRDTRRKPVGWNVVGFDDSEWQDASIVSEIETDPIPRDIPTLREHEVLPERVLRTGSVQPVDDPSLDIATRISRERRHDDPDAVRYARSALNVSGESAVVSPGRTAFVVLDFGREVVGFPLIRVRDGSAATIDIGYSLDLDETGSVDPTADGLLQADRVILHGGRQEWETFGRRGFRYMQLTFRDAVAPIHVETVAVHSIGYPVKGVSSFACSDDQLNEAWRGGVHALSVAMQDTYESSPLRLCEPDPDVASVQALANYYCFFDSLLAAKTLRCFALRPDSGLAWIRMLHEYYLYTGDKSLVQEFFPSVKQAVDRSLPRDAFHYQVLRDAAKLATTSAAIDDSVEWMSRAEAIRVEIVGVEDAPRTVLARLEVIAQSGDEKTALDLIRGGELRGEMPYAAVCFLSAEVLGVRPSMPESGVVVIQPRPGDLQWAKGHIKTDVSTVDVEWACEPGLFRLDITAPEGFIVALPVRGFRNPVIDEIDLSPETPERRARRTYGWSDTIWRDGEEHDPYIDWLKTQESEPPSDYHRRKRVSTEEEYIWVRESTVTQVRYEIREGPVP